jgi:hypothetical protein
MHIDQLPYRRLHDAILDYDGGALHDDLLRPWLRANDGERRWLDAIRDRAGSPLPPVTPEESWRLYALSRIVELLQLSFAPRTLDEGWNVASISADDHARFMDALGVEPVQHDGFHPFYHEIVTVDEMADEGAVPEVVQVCWPGYRLGPLLISRAGCRVRAGRRHVAKEIAESSTLYWAYARNNRRTQDLGSGWGGSSQWRTSFRRDYALDGALHYNVDARPRPGGADADLDGAERAELLRHRCFVRCTRPGDDRWPYELSMTEQA